MARLRKATEGDENYENFTPILAFLRQGGKGLLASIFIVTTLSQASPFHSTLNSDQLPPIAC